MNDLRTNDLINKYIAIHLKNGTKVGKTMNAYLIYRNETRPNNNSLCKEVSKLTAEGWKNEHEEVKHYYREIAEKIKERYKEIATPTFINSGTGISLEKTPQSKVQNYENFLSCPNNYDSSQSMNIENPPDTITLPLNINLQDYPQPIFSDMCQNPSEGAYLDTYFDPSLFIMDQNIAYPQHINIDQNITPDPQHINIDQNFVYPDPRYININHICLQSVYTDSPPDGQFSVSPTYFNHYPSY
ncbi:626_t:CDS:1 [Diversispora eburnea]|uniref:626_t:CDS:1 n=1 Tax=Diversispora eburnea TaxID=1213867 RepID=A0A9N8ZDR9_9GLOM|nr:626_t:CDS:1 [Diversispora eburnea]